MSRNSYNFKNCTKADIEDPKKKRAREAAKKERKRRADSLKRKQTRDTSKEAVERQRLLLEQKRAAAAGGGGDCGQSFYVSMDEMEMAQIESEREKYFQRSRPRAESSTAQKTSRIFEGICT